MASTFSSMMNPSDGDFFLQSVTKYRRVIPTNLSMFVG